MAKRSMKKYACYDKQKETTDATAFTIVQKLHGIDEYTLLNTIFFTSDDPVLRRLVNKVEYILADAVVNPERFFAELHPALLKLADEIKENNLVHKFFEMVHIMYEKQSGDGKIADAYYNLVIQLATYLTPPGTVIAGISKEGVPLHLPELYPDTDKIAFTTFKEFERKKGDTADFYLALIKAFNKYGYKNVRSYADIEYMFLDERITTDTLFKMTPFVNSLDSPLIDIPYISPTSLDFKLPDRSEVREQVERALKNRRRLLPKRGITAVNIGGSHGIDSIWVSEQLYMDRLFMLYKVKINGKSLVGYYDTESGFFYSMFLDAQEHFLEKHLELKDLILDVYANLTSDCDTELSVTFKNSEPSSTGRKGTSHVFDKDNLQEVEVDVDFYIRKLPMDATASPEAVAFAKRYGIKLNPGETFVRPFTRKAYNKSKEEQ